MRRVCLGIGTQLMFQVITGGREFVLVPLFLLAWGAEGYGRWISIYAAVSYLSLLDLGGQNYIANLLAAEQANRNEQAFRRILSESLSFYVIIVAVFFLLVLAFLIVAMNSSFLAGLVSIRPQDGWVVGFLAALILLAVPAGIYHKIYQSSGLFPQGAMIGNSMALVAIGVLGFLLYIGIPPSVYAGGFLATGVLTTLVVVWDSQRRIPACRGLRFGWAEARRGASHLKGSIYFWLIMLGQTLKLQGVILVMTAFLPADSVALYATHRLLSSPAGYAGTVLCAPLWPEFTFLWAEKRYGRLGQVQMLSVKLAILLGGATALSIWIAGPALYPYWTGHHLEFHPVLLAILMVQGVLSVGASAISWSLLSTNHHRALGSCYLANALLTIVLSLLLVKPFGVVGVAVAVLAGDAIFGISIFPFLASPLLRMPASKIFGAVAASTVTLAVLAAGAGLAHVYGHGLWSVAWFLLLSAGISYPLLRFLFGKEAMGELRQLISGLPLRLLRHQDAS